MFLLLGLSLIVIGIGCLTIDRQAAHFFYDAGSHGFHRFLDATTHWAKAGHWLAAAVVSLIIVNIALFWTDNPVLDLITQCSLAFIACLAFGSIILHGIKLVLGRRRPRDDMEMGLYGFVPFAFNLEYNSFPSGHALTIMCVAVIASCVWPQFVLVWFAIAAWLALTRAFLTAHFLSDVFIGAGIGLAVSHIVLRIWFPVLAQAWV
jgi:membrane-associated phospholipid phosphatase